MRAGRKPRAATLVVRAWREPDDPDGPLRMRVVEVPLPPARERTICTVTSVDDACAAVRAWLEREATASSGPVTES